MCQVSASYPQRLKISSRFLRFDPLACQSAHISSLTFFDPSARFWKILFALERTAAGDNWGPPKTGLGARSSARSGISKSSSSRKGSGSCTVRGCISRRPFGHWEGLGTRQSFTSSPKTDTSWVPTVPTVPGTVLAVGDAPASLTSGFLCGVATAWTLCSTEALDRANSSAWATVCVVNPNLLSEYGPFF